MIAKNKKRLNITIDKAFAEQCQTAAAEWGLTLSEYFTALARRDQTLGLTAQARCMASEARKVVKNEDSI